MSQFDITLSIIYPLFQRTGFFVEVGGSHPFEQNNTYQLEEKGWSGIVVEPLTVYNNLYKEARPNTVVENCAIVSRSHNITSTPYLIIPQCTHGSGIAELKNNHQHHLSRDPTNEIEVPCCTFDSLMRKHNRQEIDFLSIDTEGYEHYVIDGIDFNYNIIKTILIEDHGNHIYEQFNQNNDFSYLNQYGYTRQESGQQGQQLYIRQDLL